MHQFTDKYLRDGLESLDGFGSSSLTPVILSCLFPREGPGLPINDKQNLNRICSVKNHFHERIIIY